MNRGLGLLWGTLTALSLTACGDGASDGTTAWQSRFVGNWELQYRSSDSGRSYRPAYSGYRFFLNSDRTWADVDGDGGTWCIDGNEFISHPADATDTYRWELSQDTDTLRLWFLNDAGEPTGQVSVYYRTKTETASGAAPEGSG